jgi:hypothetical protein
MRLPRARPIRTGLGLCATLALTFFGCRDSNSVAGPSNGTASAMNVSGTWSGTFQPNDSAQCGRSGATATFQQQGANLTGNLTTSACGVGGYFRGTIQGNTITGRIEMAGCTGGAVTGTVGASGLSLSVADLMKPLVLGDTPAMAGGMANLTR